MATAENQLSDISSQFERDGFYHARSIYEEKSLQAMEAEFDRIVEQLENSGERINARWEGEQTAELDGGQSKIIHTHNVQRYSSLWLDALRSERFLDVVEALIGPDIVLHHTKLFQKPPKEGAPFPMHQDWSYFPTHNDTMIAGIIFLSDADAESGGLCAYPGSHKLGRVADSSGRVPSKILDQYPLENAQFIDARRGDVFFFSYLTLHGSTPNRSERYRKTVLAQVHAGSDYVVSGDGLNHVNESLVLRGWNRYMTRERAAV